MLSWRAYKLHPPPCAPTSRLHSVLHTLRLAWTCADQRAVSRCFAAILSGLLVRVL